MESKKGEESLCLQIARRMGPKDFKDWLGKAFTSFGLSERNKEQKIKILKKNMWFKDVVTLCDYIEQFPDVNETFVSENLEIMEKKPPRKKKQKIDIPKKSVSETKSPPSETKSLSETKSKEEQGLKLEEEAKIKVSETTIGEVFIPVQKSKKETEIPVETKKRPLETKPKEKLRPKFKIPIIEQTRAEKTAECVNIAVLENFTNSCYMDSILMIFFTVLEEFTEKYIIDKYWWTEEGICNKNTEKDHKIRTTIKNAFETLHDAMATLKESTQCIDFRKLLSQCDMEGFEKFSVTSEGGTMRDASEFLAFLFNLFEINTMDMNSLVLARKTGKESFDVQRSSDLRMGEPPIWIVYSSELHLQKETNKLISITVLDEPEGGFGKDIGNGKREFSGLATTRTVWDTPLLAISLQRRTFKDPSLTPVSKLLSPANELFDSISIIPSERISTMSGRILILVASVIYHPQRGLSEIKKKDKIIYAQRHYTSVFRCNNQWYHYNDIGTVHVRLFAKDWNEMVKAEDGLVSKNGVIHFYVDEENLGVMNKEVIEID